MFSLEKDTSLMFTELGMDPNDAIITTPSNDFRVALI